MRHPLYIAFVWHMHQPYYRDLRTGRCHMPWVRLHGTKDYLDMVKLLESIPSAHVTFNLVPSLLDQLEGYLPTANGSDEFLDVSRRPASELTESERQFLLRHFFMCNWERMVKPYPRYHDLLAKRGAFLNEADWTSLLRRFKPQDYLDLQVWFNLTWIDPWIRGQDPELAGLEAKGGLFTEAEKSRILEKQIEILAGIIPAYRAAQERGQVELTTSPYYHPILPLLFNLRSARVALPQVVLPEEPFNHSEDAQWHLDQALARHERAFGRLPQGIWPPEGSVNEDVVRLAIRSKLRWLATDEEILWRTIRRGRSAASLYQPHALRREEGTTAIVFRDRELSDLIGFVYSQWAPESALQDIVRRLGRIHHELQGGERPGLVSVILDGENAWEFYAGDGSAFLQRLYQTLSQDERFRLVTVSEYLDRFPVDPNRSLPELFAGSWIDGNFATWIGHPEKNAAWTQLAKVRHELTTAAWPPEEAWRSFYIAEGSDWMWWFGDTHSSAQDEEFDRLFRGHLASVYAFLGTPVPDWLGTPIKRPTVHVGDEPAAKCSPTIDGLESSYFEWLGAGRIELRKSYAAIHRGTQILQVFIYGFDESKYYFRLDVDREGLAALGNWRIELEVPTCAARLTVQGKGAELAEGAMHGPESREIQAAYRCILELAVPRPWLPVPAGERCHVSVSLMEGQEQRERYPAHGAFSLMLAPVDLEAKSWSV
ncbi:MAG: hypothetical protein HYZ92_00660 [Candidatus Omnitrophica bacterium]|nr:hypothetical protein [Candidatus Omnitrophota bacterium]